MGDELNNDISQNIIRQNKIFDDDVMSKMTIYRAAKIKVWRIEYCATHSQIAQLAYERWGNDALWHPSSNEVAGRVLCDKAAEKLGEDSSIEPWVIL